MLKTTNPVIIGGSAGSFRFLTNLVPALGDKISFPLVICIHRSRHHADGIAETLEVNAKLAIQDAQDNDYMLPGVIYIAPAQHHLVFESTNRIRLEDSPPVNFSKPSIDVTMQSAAKTFGPQVIGILLSGANADGAEGMSAIHKNGGITVVQDPNDAEINVMPEAAMGLFSPDFILPARKIISFIQNLSEKR